MFELGLSTLESLVDPNLARYTGRTDEHSISMKYRIALAPNSGEVVMLSPRWPCDLSLEGSGSMGTGSVILATVIG